MAYGTPAGLDDVEAYYTDIRRGKPPPPELLEELIGRYRAIGGRSPLLEITRSQAAGVEARLGIRCYVGQKHAAPFIADAIGEMARDEVDAAVGLVLAPHYSSMSIGDYTKRAEDAARERGWRGALHVVPSWHLEPGYVEWLASRLHTALGSLSQNRDEISVVFSAHSLPARILARADPYPQQLEETAAAVARRAAIGNWRVGWQSAGRTGEPWLGPDVLEILDELAREGASSVVVCPCGFVADHLEVLYDIDVEAAARARELGIRLVRTPSPNTDPAFLDVLATVVRGAFESREWSRADAQ